MSPEEVIRYLKDVLRQANEYLDVGLPFAAHETIRIALQQEGEWENA